MPNRTEGSVSGPLAGVRIVELAGIGPGPYAAMMLSDLGAEVVRVDRAVAVPGIETPDVDPLLRGRRSIAVDLKNPDGVETVLRLLDRADGLIEGFRPGVTERMGLGPEVCCSRNPKLVYGRMTGWGQDGPYAHLAGHDINYIALAGALAHFGREGEKPTPPINMVGDFGGGAMFLLLGMVCALFEAGRSGAGQIVDAAMVDGTASLMTMIWGFRPTWTERGTNLLDTGAPYYDTYETRDGRFIAIGALEAPFYTELLTRLGLTEEVDVARQTDKDGHGELRTRFTELFLTKTRDEWCEILEYTDACFAPVLTMSECGEHPHLKARGTIVEEFGVLQPAPAPRFSRTPGAIQGPPAGPGQHTDAILADWGFSTSEIAALHASKAIAQT